MEPERAPLAPGAAATSPDLAAARAMIAAGNVAWAKARVALDRDTFERMLEPDCHVLLRGQRLDRRQFLDRISTSPAGVTLTRFEATVLTVQHDGDDWVAVILEKLEYQRREADGGETLFLLAVTRDGWRSRNGRWTVRFSELIGEQRWGPGRRPPLPDW